MSRFALATLAASLLFASQASALTAKQTVEKEITVTLEDGTTETQRVSADTVVPGEKVVYTIDFVNDSDQPATDLILAMPVPSDVRFLDGSADRSDAVVRYSTDGGTEFAAREALQLPAVGGGMRDATPEDITHIQWTIPGPVAVGAADKVAFTGRLK